jgi:hypothetical protein
MNNYVRIPKIYKKAGGRRIKRKRMRRCKIASVPTQMGTLAILHMMIVSG